MKSNHSGCGLKKKCELKVFILESMTQHNLWAPCRIGAGNCSHSDVKMAYVQADPAGKVSILGGDGIGDCEKKSSYEHVYNSDWLPR